MTLDAFEMSFAAHNLIDDFYNDIWYSFLKCLSKKDSFDVIA